MARIRSIKPKFWDDEKLAKISRDARLLFIGMWNYSDDLGVILSNQIWLKSKIFPYDDISPEQLQNWLQELLSISRIATGTFRDCSYFRIVNFTKHQYINKPNNDDIFIPIDCISIVFDDTGSIPYSSGNDTGAIQGGKERNRIGKDRKGIEGDSGSDEFFNGNFLIPKMIGVFKNNFPSYPLDKEKDAISCREISEKIAAQKNWKLAELSNGKMAATIAYWESVVLFAKNDKWFKTRSISDLNKEWQRLIQNINSKNDTKHRPGGSGNELSYDKP